MYVRVKHVKVSAVKNRYYIKNTKWQNQDITGIKISKNQHLSTLLFADDQVIIADIEDNLQKAAYKLNQIITEYGLTVSVQKTKSVAFKDGIQ